VDSLGRIWVSVGGEPPAIYDSSGKWLRAAGRIGEGPGEYRGGTTARFINRDSIVLLDPSQNRATVLTNDLRIARTFALAHRFTELEISGRRLLGAGHFGSPSAAGYPLHLMPITNPSQILKSLSPDSVALSRLLK
jgi:hypothetical protein